ncbi:hypothetical protein Glove_40g55 [Diversispora epigaea]|uniref:F-box domain-containing protein n=1 Tax=Diversispora epigaea TaxID=1348612 RepID=A0A397JIT8_9GLOM|nr:hypothetical protein Glove_40g55 [Diversispora epigaea]
MIFSLISGRSKIDIGGICNNFFITLFAIALKILKMNGNNGGIINKLPNEILIEILIKVLEISGFKAIKNLGRTCKRWNMLIPTVIEDEMFRNYRHSWNFVIYYHESPTIFKEQTFALGIPTYNQKDSMLCFDISKIGLIDFNNKSNINIYLKFIETKFESCYIFKIDLKESGKDYDYNFKSNSCLKFMVTKKDVVMFISWSIKAKIICHLLF